MEFKSIIMKTAKGTDKCHLSEDAMKSIAKQSQGVNVTHGSRNYGSLGESVKVQLSDAAFYVNGCVFRSDNSHYWLEIKGETTSNEYGKELEQMLEQNEAEFGFVFTHHNYSGNEVCDANLEHYFVKRAEQ